MEYCGFTINLKKQQAFYEVPIRKPHSGNDDSHSLVRGSGKQALSTSVSLDVWIEGHRVIDHAFLYELRAILEEFTNKRLGESKPGRSINAAMDPFGSESGSAFITRQDSQLIIKYVTDESSEPLVILNVINAKALHAILHKALQTADFQ